MRAKFLLTAIAMTMAVCATAQTNNRDGKGIIDNQEDTADVTTIAGIIDMQQKVYSSSNTEQHIKSVWKRKLYRNISYNSSKLTSDQSVYVSDTKQDKIDCKSDWGFSFQLGTNYWLHKPIANMVTFAIDYTWMDINLNHFKAVDEHYNSTWERNDNYVMPWNLQKYEVDYGMNIGPSITVAPFVPLGNKQLDFIKLQVYYHIGYRISGLFLSGGEDDYNKTSSRNDDEMPDFKAEWGHGMYTSFGVNLTWKAIGIGYEHSSGNFKYKPFVSDFGKEKTKMKLGTSRIFLQIRM